MLITPLDPPHHNGCFVISDSSFPWKHFTMVPVGTDVKRDPECCCVALACSYWCKLTVVTAAAFLGTDIYRVSEPSGIIPDMFQVLVGYQLIRCQVSHPFLCLPLNHYPSLLFTAFYHPFGGDGKGLCGPFCLTVRDGCTGLWVTESSCVVDGVFVGQRVQECSCALRLSVGPGCTLDPLCVSLSVFLPI